MYRRLLISVLACLCDEDATVDADERLSCNLTKIITPVKKKKDGAE